MPFGHTPKTVPFSPVAVVAVGESLTMFNTSLFLMISNAVVRSRLMPSLKWSYATTKFLRCLSIITLRFSGRLSKASGFTRY